MSSNFVAQRIREVFYSVFEPCFEPCAVLLGKWAALVYKVGIPL
jgi:hypothetical protein